MRTTTDPSLVPDLDEHGQGEAAAWVVLAAAWVGLCLTAGWTVRTAWAVAHRPETLAWLRSIG